MSLPYKIQVFSTNELPRLATPGDGPFLNIKPTALATAGAGTLLANLLISGLILRTGPGIAYADTIDTGANLDIAFPSMIVNDALDIFYINSVPSASTITAAAGVTLKTATANNVIAASTGRLLHLVKTGVGTYDLYVI